MHDAWLQRERLLDEVGSKGLRQVQGQKLGILTWQARGRFSQKLVGISAASAGTVKSETCVLVTEMSSCIFSGSKSQCGRSGSWNTGETRLQGGKMQGSSGSTRISLLVMFFGSHYCLMCRYQLVQRLEKWEC